jgi:hypothetical protein
MGRDVNGGTPAIMDIKGERARGEGGVGWLFGRKCRQTGQREWSLILIEDESIDSGLLCVYFGIEHCDGFDLHRIYGM